MVNRCWSFSTSLCCWNFCNWYCESSKYNNLYTLAANHLFCHEWSYFENIMKEMVAFFLSKGIVKGGELIIYLFIYLFFAVTYFCWTVDVFVVIVVVAVCLFVFYAFFVLCCRPPISSKHFIINLQLIWAEIFPVSWSNPDPIVAIGTAVRATTKVRIGISSRIVRNIHIMAPTKGWTTIILTVSGVAVVAVGYVLFEVSIPVVVFQWVQEGICRILITSRPWRDKKQNTNN